MPENYDIELIKRRAKKAFELIEDIPLHEVKNKLDRNKLYKAYDELFYLNKYLNREQGGRLL